MPSAEATLLPPMVARRMTWILLIRGIHTVQIPENHFAQHIGLEMLRVTSERNWLAQDFFALCCLGKIPGGAPFSQLHKSGNGSRVDRP